MNKVIKLPPEPQLTKLKIKAVKSGKDLSNYITELLIKDAESDS